jgi:DNA-binding response OmpR family regulator
MKVLFMSGYTDDAVVRHGVLSSELEFVQKPLIPATLLARVRAVLDATS